MSPKNDPEVWDMVNLLFDQMQSLVEVAHHLVIPTATVRYHITHPRPVVLPWREEQKPLTPNKMLRIARQLSGLTVNQLADLAGCTNTQLSNLEKQWTKTYRIPKNAKKVCKVLQISVEDVIHGEPDYLAPYCEVDTIGDLPPDPQ